MAWTAWAKLTWGALNTFSSSGLLFWTARTAFGWNEGVWTIQVSKASAPAKTRLRVVTWNTLWDRYDSHRIDTQTRRPLLLEALESLDADVIALQEVEPTLLKMLHAADWVRESYRTSDGPSAKDVEACGVLVLSRLPIREVAIHELGNHKSAIAVVIESESGPLVLVSSHLPVITRRAQQPVAMNSSTRSAKPFMRSRVPAARSGSETSTTTTRVSLHVFS